MSEGVRGLIVTHASLGEGLVAAVHKITGADDDTLQAISNEERGPNDLIAEIRERAGEGPVLLFTDMPGGSCALAARRMMGGRPQTGLVCGVNLPLLLDFVFHRTLPLPDLVTRLVSVGREGIIGTCTEETADADHTAAD